MRQKSEVNKMTDSREPRGPEKKEPETREIPENDPPSRRRGPVEEPESDEPPVDAPTDPETEKQGEVRL